MILYCATTNPGKLREFRRASRSGWEIEPAPDIEDIPAPEETGATFADNAILKARYYSHHAGEVPLFAEDSGIEADALDGAPGVHSARFAGPKANDSENNLLLLERLKGKADRRARYVSVVALILPGQQPRIFRGTVEGEILERPRGSGGFGYDPLFYYRPFQATFAEVTPEQKWSVSHRGVAVEAMMEFLGDGAEFV
jgi:XTP/dITP diphosphohydrolase